MGLGLGLGMGWVTNLECTNSYVYRAGFGYECDEWLQPGWHSKKNDCMSLQPTLHNFYYLQVLLLEGFCSIFCILGTCIATQVGE